MKVAITGAGGLIGWHLRCASNAEGIDTVALFRGDLDDADELRSKIAGVDVVVHAAGANRGDDEVVAATNLGLARSVAAAVVGGPAVHVVYLNSTHRDRSTAYGTSKAQAASILREVCGTERVLDLVLPGVFGELGEPYYNSVVSTFGHQLAHGKPLTLADDKQIEIIHAQDVADLIISAMHDRVVGEKRVHGKCVRVTELAHKLQRFHDSYAAGIVPDIGDHFDRALFNTMRSYRFPHLYPTALTPRADQRGHLVELVKAHTGGQMFISSTVPGVTRGDHYHRRKVERFSVVDGAATISIRRLFSEDVVSFEVNGDEPVAIDMPTMHTHNITNTSSDIVVTMFWSDEIFDPANPDTYPEKVIA